MEFLKIEDVLTVASDFLQDPENQDKARALEELKSKIVIKKHLPLFLRNNTIIRTLIDINTVNEEASLEEISNAFEISLTFNCLLAYTNIDPDFSGAFKSAVAYDVLWESGIIDTVLRYCKEDYERVEKQIYQTLSYQNLLNILNTINSMKVGNIEELTKSFKDFTFNADPESIKNLAEIARFNDPIIKELKDEFIKGAYKNLK